MQQARHGAAGRGRAQQSAAAAQQSAAERSRAQQSAAERSSSAAGRGTAQQGAEGRSRARKERSRARKERSRAQQGRSGPPPTQQGAAELRRCRESAGQQRVPPDGAVHRDCLFWCAEPGSCSAAMPSEGDGSLSWTGRRPAWACVEPTVSKPAAVLPRVTRQRQRLAS